MMKRGLTFYDISKLKITLFFTYFSIFG